MHAVILAAGDGGRMGDYTDKVPKAFLDVGEKTLYERQRDAVDQHVDDVTIVLGYEYEHVLDRVGDANTVIFEEWDEYDNAESLRRATVGVDDDVIVMNGDVIVPETIVDRLTDRFESDQSLVCCLPGVQSEHTAIRCDEDGRVTEYGMIPGYRHAGLGIIARNHLPTARRVLEDHCRDWYPHLYPRIETRRIVIPESRHIEINRPHHLMEARERLPLDSRSNVGFRGFSGQ